MTDTSRSGDLVERLRKARVWPDYSQSRVTIETAHEAADRIEQLEREKAVVFDLWEQQKEIALGYLADCNKAADLIEAQDKEIERLREALEHIGIYGCGMLNQPPAMNGPEEDWLKQRIFEMERTARAALGDKP